jgi:hypothetical protein
MRFKISEVDDTPVERMGAITNIDTEKNRFIYQTEQIDTKKTGEGKIRFNTGFFPEPIQRNKYFSNEEKEVLIKAQEESYKIFLKEITGKEDGLVEDTDVTIWLEGDYGHFTITTDTFSTIFDTKDVHSMVVYWQIMCGAYTTVGANLQDAIEKGAKYFLQPLLDAELRDAEEENQKIKAITLLGNLKETDNADALLYLCWSLGSRKEGLVGYSKSTPIVTLSKALYNFIQGNTRTSNKRSCPKEFILAVSEFNLNKDDFMIKVVVKAADYHSLISTNASGNYVNGEGVVLGKTIDECVKSLKKASMRDVFEDLHSEVVTVLVNND